MRKKKQKQRERTQKGENCHQEMARGTPFVDGSTMQKGITEMTTINRACWLVVFLPWRLPF